MPHAAPPNLRLDRPSPRGLREPRRLAFLATECVTASFSEGDERKRHTLTDAAFRASLIHGGCQSITHGQRSLPAPAPAACTSADVTTSHSLGGAPRVPRSTATLVTVAVFLRALKPRCLI